MGTVTPKFWRECKWIDDHYEELVKKYANRWIGVVNQKVAAASSNLAEVEKEILNQTKRKDIPIIYIEDGSHVY